MLLVANFFDCAVIYFRYFAVENLKTIFTMLQVIYVSNFCSHATAQLGLSCQCRASNTPV